MFLPTSQNTKTVTDMRENAVGLLRDVQKLGMVYLFQHSDPMAVVLSMDEFARFQKWFADYLEEKEARELENEDKTGAIEFKKIAKKYVKSV